jgi:ABC-type multidrug transport system ATPase subunit
MSIKLIENLNFKYKNSSQLFKDFSLEVGEYNIIGLVGKNGSGKTTLLKILSEVLPAQFSFKSIQSSCYSNGRIAFHTSILTLGSYIDFLMLVYSVATIPAELNEFLASKNTKSTLVSELSKGEIQFICISIALSTSKEHILLDETFSSLDETKRLLVVDKLKSLKNKKIIVTSHNLVQTQICDYLVVLEKGTIKYNGKAKIINSMLELY